MRSKFLLMLFVICVLNGFFSTVYASLINIDFGHITPNPTYSYGAAAGQLGYWNLLPSTSSIGTISGSLADTDGNYKGSTYHIYFHNKLGNHENNILTGDMYYSPNGYNWWVNLYNIENGKYDLYIYSPDHPSVATGNFLLDNSTGSGNYVYGSSISNGYLILSIYITNQTLRIRPHSDYSGLRGLAGLQLVEANPVPIPDAVWLIGTGLVCLIGLHRRN